MTGSEEEFSGDWPGGIRFTADHCTRFVRRNRRPTVEGARPQHESSVIRTKPLPLESSSDSDCLWFPVQHRFSSLRRSLRWQPAKLDRSAKQT